MQYQVPQFIDVEDKIVGPLTLKQFLYLAGGGAVVFFFFTVFKIAFAIILGIPVAAASFLLAFGTIKGVPLPRYLISLGRFAFKPQKYLWRK